jgi:hypothetical protein
MRMDSHGSCFGQFAASVRIDAGEDVDLAASGSCAAGFPTCLHTFATVLGLMLVSLARIALRTEVSARRMMQELAEIKVTLVKTKTGATGRRPMAMLAPKLTAEQRRAVKRFELQRWAPVFLHV